MTEKEFWDRELRFWIDLDLSYIRYRTFVKSMIFDASTGIANDFFSNVGHCNYTKDEWSDILLYNLITPLCYLVGFTE